MSNFTERQEYNARATEYNQKVSSDLVFSFVISFLAISGVILISNAYINLKTLYDGIDRKRSRINKRL